MTTDELREQIQASADGPRGADGLRAAVQFAAEHPALVLVEGELLARIAEAMDIHRGEAKRC